MVAKVSALNTDYKLGREALKPLSCQGSLNECMIATK